MAERRGFSRTSLGTFFAGALLVATLPFAQVRGAYEFDASSKSDLAVERSLIAYAEESDGLEQLYYLAFVYSYYGNYYADYAYETGDHARFYDAAVFQYLAYAYYDALYEYRAGVATDAAREYSYFAYVFCWYAFTT